jgi:hypothetical protein
MPRLAILSGGAARFRSCGGGGHDRVTGHQGGGDALGAAGETLKRGGGAYRAPRNPSQTPDREAESTLRAKEQNLS